MIPPWENYFGKITAWSLIYFLNYAQFDILTQSQILGLTLYFFSMELSFLFMTFTFIVFIKFSSFYFVFFLFYDLVCISFQKLWAVCDLAISLLFKKTTNFELKEFPAKLNLSALYFKDHPEGENFVNGNTYIPTEMIYQPPKKAGASLFITRKATATSSTTSIKSTGKVRNRFCI